jgi:porin
MVRLRHVFLAACAVLALGAPARADMAEFGPRSDGPSTSTLRNTLPDGGDPFGVVRRLSERGIEFRLSYITDVLGNVQGGQRRGWISQGLFEPSVSLDFERLVGISGLRAYANALVIHNTGRILRDKVGGVNTIAAIEAMPRVRLSEAWIEQSFAGGQVRLRAGQLAADVLFFYSDLSVMFLQSDYPTIAALNQPGGGPAYPLATPGLLLEVEPARNLTLRAALFNGQTARPDAEEPQIANRYNTLLRVRDPALVFAEGRYAWRREEGLAGAARLGGWAHLGRFDHQSRAGDGTRLAELAGATPLRRRGSGGLYAVLDQQLWRPAGGDALSGVSVFGRVSVSPSDRSVIGFYVDGGVVVANMVPGRPQDRFGLSVIHSRFAKAVRNLDQDLIAAGRAAPGTVRRAETSLEFSYLAEMMPGIDLQPVLTHVWNPAGRPGRNALVVGARARFLY